jgi:hypothetical protein
MTKNFYHDEIVARMADPEDAADYEQAMIDAWKERETDEYFLEQEKFEDFFDDYRIDVTGYEEIFEPQPTVLVDDDIPF